MSSPGLSGIGNRGGIPAIEEEHSGPNNNQLGQGIAARGAEIARMFTEKMERLADAPVHSDDKVPPGGEVAFIEAVVQRLPPEQERERAWLSNRNPATPRAFYVESAKVMLRKIENQAFAQGAKRRAEFENLVREGEQKNSPQALIKVLQSAEPSRNLLSQVQAMHPDFSLSFPDVSKQDLPAAHCNPESGTIRIRKNLPFRMKISCLIFELANLSHAPYFAAIDQEVFTGKIADPNLYAKAMERVEYDSCKVASKTVQACIEKAGWDPEIDDWEELAQGTFEECYAEQQRKGHSNRYLQQFHIRSLLSEAIKDAEASPRTSSREAITGEALPQEPDSAQEGTVRKDALSQGPQASEDAEQQRKGASAAPPALEPDIEYL